MQPSPTQNGPCIIAFASPKGGVGKSTLCACLAGALISRGHTVTILDLDQNRTLDQWARRFPTQIGSLAVEAVPDGGLIDRVRTLCAQPIDFILIDAAGVLQTTTIAAAALAHLTITPSKLSAPDIIEAVKLHREVRNLGDRVGKPIDHRLLLNEVSPLWPTYQRAALVDVERSGLIRFDTVIHARAPYAEMFLTGQTPHASDKTREPVIKAVAQLDALTDEVLAALGLDDLKEAASWLDPRRRSRSSPSTSMWRAGPWTTLPPNGMFRVRFTRMSRNQARPKYAGRPRQAARRPASLPSNCPTT